MSTRCDAVVIGGGFYGAQVAIHLAQTARMERVVLIEREPQLMLRASFNNQARIHNGYHYPRSFTTAYRSRVNYSRFMKDWPSVVENTVTHYYAVAQDSKVSPQHFERFCAEIGAPLRPAPPHVQALFDMQRVARVYAVEEAAFDATLLAREASKRLERAGVDAHFSTQVSGVTRSSGRLCVTSPAQRFDARIAFNCCYSGLNQIGGAFEGTHTRLKHEITEMALIEVPEPLRSAAVTVVDGPYFSVMPAPAHKLHTLSHVRYTPHCSWTDEAGDDPYQRLSEYPKESRADRMLRDAARYLPVLSEACYRSSLFEVKTVLGKSESDDSRPILFEQSTALPGFYSILGGKIDNIYDIFERLDSEQLIWQ
jgi:glycine/D-amino acid oxidase-like deaminating enzyme